MRLARFACDVTPPLGHPLCGGWIEPVKVVDDPLEARGVVILDAGKPIVLCAVDWCALRNDSHARWRDLIAAAVGTDPNRVAVQTLHQHDAPMADLGAQRLLDLAPDTTPCVDAEFHERAARDAANAARAAMADPVPFDHVGVGKARVDRVASNRRVLLGPDGRVVLVRTSSAGKDPRAREAPEGLVDPWLRTIGFWNGDRPLAALSYYATHPMSHYGKGRVSSDFVGLARRLRQAEMPDVFQVYFTGCAGNVTAGKYNAGTDDDRVQLRDRIHAALRSAWDATERVPVDRLEWRVAPVRLPSRDEPQFGGVESINALTNPSLPIARRNNAAMQLAWLLRLDRAIDVTCLRLGPAAVIHLPGEPFVEFALHASRIAGDRLVAVAGYGDDGPGYVLTREAFGQGGYEPTVALSGPGSQAILEDAIERLLRG